MGKVKKKTQTKNFSLLGITKTAAIQIRAMMINNIHLASKAEAKTRLRLVITPINIIRPNSKPNCRSLFLAKPFILSFLGPFRSVYFSYDGCLSACTGFLSDTCCCQIIGIPDCNKDIFNIIKNRIVSLISNWCHKK